MGLAAEQVMARRSPRLAPEPALATVTFMLAVMALPATLPATALPTVAAMAPHYC
jgi:hypothetical protein